MKLAVYKNTLVAFCLTLALLAIPANAVVNELVGSSESHSIEKFDNNGNWIKTFASTGPYVVNGLAASPVTGDVFATTNTPTILRYTKTGAAFGPKGSYWSSFNLSSLVGSNTIDSVLFDSSGNLYVATYYGTGGYQVVIIRFAAKEILKASPTSSGTIATNLNRGFQMAWDVYGDLCLASWDSETVQCFNPGTGALVFDYASEMKGLLEPGGLAFGPDNILTVSDLFTGEVWVEAVPRQGPMNELASGMVHDVYALAADNSGALYLPSFHNPEGRYEGQYPYDCTYYACMDGDFSSDLVYKIDPATGAVTNFIATHIWGPYQMIFVPF
jgi:DNA-binding beta-propeller fold protein YncE